MKRGASNFSIASNTIISKTDSDWLLKNSENRNRLFDIIRILKWTSLFPSAVTIVIYIASGMFRDAAILFSSIFFVFCIISYRLKYKKYDLSEINNIEYELLTNTKKEISSKPEFEAVSNYLESVQKSGRSWISNYEYDAINSFIYQINSNLEINNHEKQKREHRTKLFE